MVGEVSVLVQLSLVWSVLTVAVLFCSFEPVLHSQTEREKGEENRIIYSNSEDTSVIKNTWIVCFCYYKPILVNSPVMLTNLTSDF